MAKGRGGHVLATVLFTDIVDSSRLARELGDRRWRVLLARHHSIVRKALKRFHGKEVDNAGDGFFATFDDQVNAIRCACAISDGVRKLGIDVRAGCHVGQAEVLGRKLGGITIHTGARVMSEAAPGEVLVSSMIRDLVPASGFEFDDRGVHQLKGIDGEWHLFAVTTVDGVPRLGPIDPAEAERLREEIKPPPIVQRRWGRIGIATLGVVSVAGATFLISHRPHPIKIRPSSLVRIDPATDEIVADVPVVEPGAAQIAIVPPHEVWVLSQPDQVISIIDANTNEPAGNVPVMSGQANSGLTGFGIVFGAGRVWVAPLAPSNTIEEIDPLLRRVEHTLRVPASTGRLAWGFGRLWVPVMEGGANHWHLTALDPVSGRVLLDAKTGYEGYGVEVGEGSAWVVNRGVTSLSKVDPRSGATETIDLSDVGLPSGIGFGFGSVWVSDDLNGVVYRIDPATDKIKDTIRIAAGIGYGSWSEIRALGNSMWVTSPSSKAIVRIDPATDTVRARIHVPYPPQSLVVGYGSVWATLTANPQ